MFLQHLLCYIHLMKCIYFLLYIAFVRFMCWLCLSLGGWVGGKSRITHTQPLHACYRPFLWVSKQSRPGRETSNFQNRLSVLAAAEHPQVKMIQIYQLKSHTFFKVEITVKSILSTFKNLLQNHKANFNQTQHKTSWVKGVQVCSNKVQHFLKGR